VSFQAVKKGLSSTMVGAIIGIFELVIVLLAPLYGKYVRNYESLFFVVSFALVLPRDLNVIHDLLTYLLMLYNFITARPKNDNLFSTLLSYYQTERCYP